MDLSSLPDLAQHFVIAMHFMPDGVQEIFHQAQNFSAAFGPESHLNVAEKIYHAGKIVAVGGLFAVSVATGNVEGALATGFTEADEVYSLCKEGAHASPVVKSDNSPPPAFPI